MGKRFLVLLMATMMIFSSPPPPDLVPPLYPPLWPLPKPPELWLLCPPKGLLPLSEFVPLEWVTFLALGLLSICTFPKNYLFLLLSCNLFAIQHH